MRPVANRMATILTVVSLSALTVFVLRYRDAFNAPRHEQLVDAAARLPFRLTEARLTGFRFAPADRKRTGREDTNPAIARLQTLGFTIAGRPSPDIESVHTAAIARALTNRPREAVALLARAVREQPANATYWSDYAAVLYEGGIRAADPSMLALSTAAADRALELEPKHEEAAFNRALALEALHLDPFATDAFNDYLKLDRASPWAAEATARRNALQRATRIATFKETLDAIGTKGPVPQNLVASLVAASPRDARRLGEAKLLTSWAEKVESDPGGAARDLELARMIGMLLVRRLGEQCLADSVEAIDRASAADRRSIKHALTVYKRGRLAYAEERLDDAIEALSDSFRRFETLRHPLALVARYYLASALADASRREEAVEHLSRVGKTLPRGYRALSAQVRWAEGTVTARLRRYGDAERLYREAAELFTALGEHQDAARLHHMIAHVLVLLGRPAEAWEMRANAFQAAAESGDDSLFAIAVSETAQQAMVEQQWDVAHSFYRLTLDAPGRDDVQESNARAERALASWRSGVTARAERELADADRAIGAITDPTIRALASHTIGFARALIIERDQPARAAELVRAAIDFHAGRGMAYAMPWLLAADARLLRREGSLDASIERLEEAIALIERGAEGLSAPLDRDHFYGTVAALHRDLADAYFAAGRAGAAFELVEQQQSRVLIAGVAAPPRARAVQSLSEVATKIPPRTTVLHYTVTGDRIWLFTIRDGKSALHLLPARATSVENEIEQLCAALENGDAAADALSRNLYSALIEPVTRELAGAERLVFVLDDALARVPLAALRNSTFLIERAEIVVAPSANVYTARLDTPAHRGTGAVIVSDPAFDAERYSTLSRLPGAADEGRAIGPMYTPASTFTGRAATVPDVLRAMQSAAVV
ncbi:MAG TPA: CHAT domain-containing protein, partial [Thermoanaerobaculia bacterium]